LLIDVDGAASRGRNNRIHSRYWTEYHAGHGFIVPPQIGEHPVMGSQSEAAWNCRGEVKIGPIEEHARMSDAIFRHAGILNSRWR
jgi:hypothetical protein